jgi:cobalt-precorrin 5A hydrolase/precorrin-3B C17-methyltransferase
VAEAAALRAAGVGGELLVGKRRSAHATVAVARRRPRGHLAVVGLGPGTPALRTPAAENAIRRAQVVVGYERYIELCDDVIGAGHDVLASAIGDERLRAKQAVAEAAAGRGVALVCSGDAGVFGMASLAFEVAAEIAPDLAIEVVPGITAALAAAVLGAPLAHDHAAISLSDLLTPWAVIERRLRAVAEADLVVSLYNPRSAGRTWQFDAARAIFAAHRSSTTPVGVVTDAGRAGQHVRLTTLAELDAREVGMTTCVVIGSTTTRCLGGRMVTPRGYAQ